MQLVIPTTVRESLLAVSQKAGLVGRVMRGLSMSRQKRSLLSLVFRFNTFVIGLVAALSLSFWATSAGAYESYHDPALDDAGYCVPCHSGFTGRTKRHAAFPPHKGFGSDHLGMHSVPHGFGPRQSPDHVERRRARVRGLPRQGLRAVHRSRLQRIFDFRSVEKQRLRPAAAPCQRGYRGLRDLSRRRRRGGPPC